MVTSTFLNTGSKFIFAVAMMLAVFSSLAAESWPTNYATFGKLIVTQFVTAPFPHPARAEGHKYHDQFFSATEHYSNSDVAIFIPKGFRATDKVDFVVHFHGWNNTVAGTLAQFQLIEQFCDSGKNAILIVPEGPHNASDSFGGKLEDPNGFKGFMDEAVEKIRASGALENLERRSPTRPVTDLKHAGSETGVPQIGSIILSGHSGGYHVMAAILDRGGLSQKIKEVWLFDALYGGTENFVAWQKKEDGRLLDIYTDHGGTKDETEKLMTSLQTNGVSFFAAEETKVMPDNLRTNKIIFLHSDLPHNEVIFRRGEFAQFLKTSCLENK